MSKDFKPGVDKPIWSLSSYGPAKYEPNLVSGVDESFEELRVKATLALKNNAGQEYVCPHCFCFALHQFTSFYSKTRSNSRERKLQLQTNSTIMLKVTFSRLMSKQPRTVR
jgi:nucleoporin NUP42